MKVKKAKKLLNKISGLLNAMENEAPSALERDLLLSYTRELYEILLNHNQSFENGLETKNSQHDLAKLDEPGGMTEKAVKNEPVSDSENQDDQNAESFALSVDPKPAGSDVKDDVLEDLFKIGEVTELSERLGLSPIGDINQALSINERILVINELFGGRRELFDQTISDLNSFFSFEQAKAYLKTGAASKYSWGEEPRNKRARGFIRIVNRRYAKSN